MSRYDLGYKTNFERLHLKIHSLAFHIIVGFTFFPSKIVAEL